MRTHYAEYTKHALRAYFRHYETQCLAGDFSGRKDCDTQNNQACYAAIKNRPAKEQACLRWLFNSTEPLNVCVMEMSAMTGIPENNIWNMLTEVQKHIAQERGLI